MGIWEDLRHYARTPVTLEDRIPDQDKVGLKPTGLWVSAGSAWLDWCRGEEFRADMEWYEHGVIVAAEANILHLGSAFDLDDFTAEYGSRISPSYESNYIDWGRVAGRYDGILIEPYQWSRRSAPHTFWYYGWDVASGCIWNPAIVSLGEAVEVSFAAQEADR